MVKQITESSLKTCIGLHHGLLLSMLGLRRGQFCMKKGTLAEGAEEEADHNTHIHLPLTGYYLQRVQQGQESAIHSIGAGKCQIMCQRSYFK